VKDYPYTPKDYRTLAKVERNLYWHGKIADLFFGPVFIVPVSLLIATFLVLGK